MTLARLLNTTDLILINEYSDIQIENSQFNCKIKKVKKQNKFHKNVLKVKSLIISKN